MEKILLGDLYSLFKKHQFISTDTRSIRPGSLFFALKGPTFNGNQFATIALALGAAFAIIDDAAYGVDSRYILVEDGLKALQELANYHRRQLKIPVLGITGSNGKTTTKELIRAVLEKKFITLATKGNLNNHIGVPLTILSITDKTEFAVIEMGANHQKEIESYCHIAKPDFGLITNVGKAHLEGFGGFNGVKKGKGELYQWISSNGKKIFLNASNEHLVEMASSFSEEQKVHYSTDEKSYCNGKLLSDTPFLTVEWKCEGRKGTIHTQLIGAYNFENVLSAICIGNYFGITPADIDQAIASYVPDNSRSQLIKKGSTTILLDAYNANPTSMEAALKNFEKIEADQKIICIGDMAELGDESMEEHQRIIDVLKKMKYDYLLLVGKNFANFTDELPSIPFETSELATDWFNAHPVQNATILIKGSRSSQMEKILAGIPEGK